MKRKQKKILIRIFITIISLIIFNLFVVKSLLKLPLYLLIYIIIGYDIIVKAFKGIINGKFLDENFLMTIATIGCFIIGYTKTNDYFEGIMVMLLFQIGEFFQSFAVHKSRKSITNLLSMKPNFANIEINGEIIVVNPEEVNIGDIIIVRPGEKIPIDGIIVNGQSTVNTSSLTGESMPLFVSVNDEVLSGYINITNTIKIKTTKLFSESSISKILGIIEQSNLTKAKSENFITKFSRYYTPFVCLSAVLISLIPLLLNLFLNLNVNIYTWIYRSLTFLVASCPCALVISIPLSFFMGIGSASRKGILVKGANHLEDLSKTKTIVFDKTGTLTKGVFNVIEVKSENSNYSDSDLLKIAATVESNSLHPISKSIIDFYNKKIDNTKIKEFRDIPGKGVICFYDDFEVACGNEKLMNDLKVNCTLIESIYTVVYISISGQYCGYIIIADEIKESSVELMKSLKKLDINNTVMLTGDKQSIAKKVSDTLNISKCFYELLPTDKANLMNEIKSTHKKNEKVIYIGDGLNDCIALNNADISITLGEAGVDAAIDLCDIIITNDNMNSIASIINISRKTMKIVFENVFLSITIKLLSLILTLFGITNMAFAIFADVGVMILAVLNTFRILN